MGCFNALYINIYILRAASAYDTFSYITGITSWYFSLLSNFTNTLSHSIPYYANSQPSVPYVANPSPPPSSRILRNNQS